MQEILKQLKQSFLNDLRAKRTETEAQKDILAAQKYADKKANVDVEIQKLDEALDLTIKQKQAKLNEEIALLRQEVAEKKANYDVVAKSEAETEAQAEVAHILRDFDTEIAKLESELA